MKISVSYALPNRQILLTVDLPDGAIVKEAIERSGILKQFPAIDLKQQKVGVFNKVTTLETVLADGDRVEIYRALTVDPKTVRRKTKSDGADAKD
ncbi:Protein RnfH [Gammaproteobacteria bacterium]